MIENRTPVDRAVLVGAPTRAVDERLAQEHMQELARLTDTAGGEVVSIIQQRIRAPHPRFFIGKGKADEVRDEVKAFGADLVIFDEELSPGQGKHLEDHVGARVVDRSELILDIFGSRARTSEAKMQVELAQLEYLLPRLKRMWSHLSRIRGGIGLRGPGETQLETDRRLIGKRISDLKRKLRAVAKARSVQRQSRRGSYRVALVGYTNAGKSSLLKTLSGADLFVENRLFATLDSATCSVDLGSGHQVLMTDTVGFIRKLPHHLIASFRSTLEEAAEADVLLHVLDASHPDWEEQKEVVEEVLEELGLEAAPQILAFNKVDRLTHAEEEAMRQRTRNFDPTPALFLSALEPESLEGLKETLKARIRASLTVARISLPAHDGATLATIYREGEVVTREDNGGTVTITVRMPEASLSRLRRLEVAQVVDAE